MGTMRNLHEANIGNLNRNIYVRILIIEDNESVAKGIAYRFQDRGHATDLIYDGLDADEFLKSDNNDIIILDINLPSLNGIEVLSNLRNRNDQRPVLLLTAKGDVESRVLGLDAGADDYLSKPFDMNELEARVRALLRRKSEKIQTTLEFGQLSFNANSRQFQAKSESLDLPRKELALLEKLITSHERVISKNNLIEHVYGTGADVEESAIEAHLSRLRKRLKPYLIEIQVQRGLGYKLINKGE